MIRVIGIIAGGLFGWYFPEEDWRIIVPKFLAVVVILTAANLLLALREWKQHPGRVSIEAINKAILGADMAEVERVTKDIHELKEGRMPTKMIVRYIFVCFLLNTATVGGIAAITYIIRGFI